MGPVETTRKAGVFTFFCCFSRPFRTNWEIVGTPVLKTHTKAASPSVGRTRGLYQAERGPSTRRAPVSSVKGDRSKRGLVRRAS